MILVEQSDFADLVNNAGLLLLLLCWSGLGLEPREIPESDAHSLFSSGCKWRRAVSGEEVGVDFL